MRLLTLVAGLSLLVLLRPAEPGATAVPWPRGIRFHEGKLIVLGRGAHRSAGGPNAEIEDRAGYLFLVDPDVHEPVVAGEPVGPEVRENGRILASPTAPPFRLWNREMPARNDTLTDRPYCQLVYDGSSRNFFTCAFGGIDLGTKEAFRKNATDGVHRFDLRTAKWHAVEAHDPDSIPAENLSRRLPNEIYPHHDPAENAPPHGLVNGPCGAAVCGDFLYVGAKDNTALAQYDLVAIRKDPAAPPPPARLIFHRKDARSDVFLPVKGRGDTYVEGTCALAAHGGFLYVAFRTTSQILRFPVRANGDLVRPLRGEQVAQFRRYDPETGGGSSNIYDMTFDRAGRLYVSPAYRGAVYRFRPDPDAPVDATGDELEPYVDLRKLTGDPGARTGNICLDDAGNLYVCSGREEVPEARIRGVVYRVPAR